MGEDNVVSEDCKKIQELLNDEMTSEEIAEKMNKDISEINSILMIMEIEGIVEKVPGNYYKRVN